MVPLIIRRMSATFGKLDKKTLELAPGLNIIQAPNEMGKSTWCAFLLAMLYGVNSRERDRAGFIAEKNRYAPWSGAAMSGRLDCAVGDGELTLTRQTRRPAAPLGEFRAVYAGTGDEFPGLSAQSCGETLLGVSREVYERSAFIRQAGLAVSQDPGLERRIAALITTGEEDTSYTEAEAALRKQRNSRRHNKTGQIPALEAELAEVRSRLSDLETLDGRLLEARGRDETLAVRERELTEKLALHERWDAAQKRRALAAAEAAARDAEDRAEELRRRAETEKLPENERIARLRGAIVNLETTRKAADKAMAEKDTAMKASVKAETALSESPFAGKTAEEARREAETIPTVRAPWTPAMMGVALAAILFFAGAIFALLSLRGDPSFAVTGTAAGVLFALGAGSAPLLWKLRRRGAAKARDDVRLKRYGTADSLEIAALAEDYAKLLENRDAAQKAVTETAAAYNTLYAALSSNEQGILLEVRRFAPAAFDVSAADAALRECAVRRRELSAAESAAREARLWLEVQTEQTVSGEPGEIESVPPPAEDRKTLETALAGVRADLSATRSASDRLLGQKAALGDHALLTAQAGRLTEQIQALEGEYAAIDLALETLDGANTALQNRFAPALGKRAAEIFSALTEGAYSAVTLDRELRLSAQIAGDPVGRDAQLLSAGALDQLYLAVRLAICALVLPETGVPIVLDDALANFDDGRMALALRRLKAESAKRQILLFTCHSREADFFRDDPSVSIQRLTAAAREV